MYHSVCPDAPYGIPLVPEKATVDGSHSFFAVLAWTGTEVILKASVEILGTTEAGLITDFRDRQRTVTKKLCSFVEPLVDEVTSRGDSQKFLRLTIKGGTPYAHQCGELVYIKIRIIEMFVNKRVHTGEKALVGSAGDQYRLGVL